MSRIRDYNLCQSVLSPGTLNGITDVSGVKVGHFTAIDGDDIRTGVTAIIPIENNIYKSKIPAAVYIGNGFGKFAGFPQIDELGNLETPIVLTNTLSVAPAIDALIDYTFSFPDNNDVISINAVVGETNDGKLNNIRKRIITKENILQALKNATKQENLEGNIGAGTGTVCFGYKGGIGTSSRVLPENLGGYTVGVLVQTNFDGNLNIYGIPVGKLLNKFIFSNKIENTIDGSCMIVIATNAPLCSRNLKRLAKRAMLGLAKTGGIASNGSGDFIIAFSTAEKNRENENLERELVQQEFLKNDKISPLFLAVIESVEEAILNSLFAAKTMKGYKGKIIDSLPIETIIKLATKYI